MIAGFLNHQRINTIPRWWQLKYFLCSPLFGEGSHFDSYFQRGWFNHQRVWNFHQFTFHPPMSPAVKRSGHGKLADQFCRFREAFFVRWCWVVGDVGNPKKKHPRWCCCVFGVKGNQQKCWEIQIGWRCWLNQVKKRRLSVLIHSGSSVIVSVDGIGETDRL